MEINNLNEDDVLDIVKDAVSSNLIPEGSWCEDGSIRMDIKTLRNDIDEMRRLVDALSSLAISQNKVISPWDEPLLDTEVKKVVVTKTDDGKQYRIKCPFCKEIHLHGTAALGLRESHCFKGQYKLVEEEE